MRKSVSIVRITEFARVSVMRARQASARLNGTSEYFCMKFNTGCRSLVNSNATTGDLRRTAPAIIPESQMAGYHERRALCSAISASLVNFIRDSFYLTTFQWGREASLVGRPDFKSG